MNCSEIGIDLDSEHIQCIISLINKITAKSPHLDQLKSDSIVFIRLVSVISLIETTLESKYQIVLKRNSTHNQSIRAIKSWLQQYYSQELITCLGRKDNRLTNDKNNRLEEESAGNGSQSMDRSVDNTDNSYEENNIDNNEVNNEDKEDYATEDIDRDIGLIALLILFIAHKLRQSLPRINAYFSPEWQTLSPFDSVLNRWINYEKLLDLVQKELCAKRKQLEVTRSKVLSLQAMINSRNLDQNRDKPSKPEYRSNLFSEYEDNDIEDVKDFLTFDENEEDVSEYSDVSPVFVDHSSDDDYEPKNKSQKISHKSSVRKTPIGKRSSRGRGRPPRTTLSPIRMTAHTQSGRRSRGRPPKAKPNSIAMKVELESESESGVSPKLEFECDVCGKEFAKEYRLTRHKFTHLGRKQFCCDYEDCGESFDLKWKLAEHKTEHTGRHEDSPLDDSFSTNNHYFQCEWADCGMGFTSKRELTQHEHEMHANRSTSKYSCDWPQCRENFENKIEWRKHVRTHGKIVPTECGFPGCQKSFFKLDSLESHRKIHETFSLDELS